MRALQNVSNKLSKKNVIHTSAKWKKVLIETETIFLSLLME